MQPIPSNLYSDKIAPVQRADGREVFFVRFEASPTAQAEDFGKVGGAFVNCYVDVDSLRAAEISAVQFIRRRGWQPKRFETWKLTRAGCFSGPPLPEESGSRYAPVWQARNQEIVCTFFCWTLHPANVDVDEPLAQTTG